MKEYNEIEALIADTLHKGKLLELNNDSEDFIRIILKTLINKRVFGIWDSILDPIQVQNNVSHETYSLIENHLSLYHKNFVDHLDSMISINNELRSTGIEYVFLKGSALRVSSYEFCYKRFTRDIDILVKEKNLHKAYESMKKLGYLYADAECSDSTDGSLDYARHIPKMINSRGIIIEIHHRISDPKNSSKCKLSRRIMDERVEIDYFNHKFNIPNKEHMFAHLLHHELTQKKEKNILLLLSDLKKLLKNEEQTKIYKIALNEISTNKSLINNLNLSRIDRNFIEKYRQNEKLSLFKKIKLVKKRISYTYQIPLEEIKLKTCIKFIMAKIYKKLLFK